MKKHLAVLGVFIVSAILLFTVGIFLIGDRHQAFSRHEDLYVEMAGVNGLAAGTQVRVEGFVAGQIKSIELPNRPSGKFRLKLEVVNKLRSLIREDSVATVDTDGLVGDKFLLIRNGSDDSPEAKNGSTIPSKEPIELSAVIAKVSGVVDQANTTISDVHLRLDGVLADFKTTVDNTNGLVTEARSGKGTVGTLLNDPETAAQVKQAVGHAEQASENLEQASAKARQMVADFQAHNLPAKVDDSVANVRHASQQIDYASTSVNSTLT
jgi:phospholipid/cholesterol/gamma-HCH transport system substrate-binding protein